MEVALADAQLGRLRRALHELGLANRTALIVGSDHGEGFGEHRVFYHNKTLYEVMVHVPLMFEIPGVKPREVDDFVSLMDVGPTVLALFGAPTPGYFMGESLVPYLSGGRADTNRLILMEKREERAMVFPDGLKVMRRGPSQEIYDIRRDPTEADNLWDSLGTKAAERLALMDAYVEVHSGKVELAASDSDPDE
jgi:arylsulfatase A-like enzyme